MSEKGDILGLLASIAMEEEDIWGEYGFIIGSDRGGVA